VDNFVQSADNEYKYVLYQNPMFIFSFASRDRLSDLIAEHLDHIHYINDVLGLRIDGLNDVLVTQLLQRLFIPLYLGSLAPELQVQTLFICIIPTVL
jgi:protein CLEC16A